MWHVRRVVSSFPLVPSAHALSKRVSRRCSEGGTQLGGVMKDMRWLCKVSLVLSADASTPF